MVLEHVPGQGPPHAHFVKQAAAQVERLAARESQAGADGLAFLLYVSGQPGVANTDQSQIEHRGTVPCADSQVIQQRGLFPAQRFLLHACRQEFGVRVRQRHDVKVVLSVDATLHHLAHSLLDRERLAGIIQHLEQPATHPVIAPGIGDEPGLVGGILAAVGKDEQAILAVVLGFRLAIVLFGQALDEAFGQDTHRSGRPQGDRCEDIAGAGGATADQACVAGRGQGHGMVVGSSIG